MSSKICPSCNTANNPSFEICWHCGQPLDPKKVTQAAILPKKPTYDVLKLSRFSYLLSRDNLKVALFLSPWIIAMLPFNYAVSKVLPDSKWLQLAVITGPGTLILGWCIKYLFRQKTGLNIAIPENIFITGLKTHLYAVLPGLLVELKMFLIYVLLYVVLLILKVNPILILNSPRAQFGKFG